MDRPYDTIAANAAIPKAPDKMTKAHLDDLRHRIADALKGKAGVADEE